MAFENRKTRDGLYNLIEFTRPELEAWFEAEFKWPKFRATQVWQWIWQKMERNFAAMTNVSAQARELLAASAVIRWPEIVDKKTSLDGTTKFLLRMDDGVLVETALIPAENRAGATRWSQCVSTQAGCPMGCVFCATGGMGFERNLSAGEIMGQVLIGREYLNDKRLDWPILRNLVFMGMGEPLLNLDALMPALRSLGDDKGMNFSPRRMTVSTCGVEKGLKVLGESGLAYLAVSLHAPNQELREYIMPRAAIWPLDKMLDALRSYPLKTRERITFEYLLLGGVNDGLEHARELARIMSSIKAKLNLIIFNPSPGLPFKPPTAEAAAAFQDYLCSKNIMVITRKSRGADIMAACGQLKADRARVNQ